MALLVNMIGSMVSLSNSFVLPLDSLFRLSTSAITVAASLLQVLWLYAGSLEIVSSKKMDRRLIKIISIAIIPISILLVLLYYDIADAGANRIFYRVGIKSLIAGVVFVVCALMLRKISDLGLGIRFIIFSFSIYGIFQFNIFLTTLFDLYETSYPLAVPYLLRGFDILLQAIMGLGMIISVLEIEQLDLKKANSELDTFLYRSSHDLRAPLTTISGIVSAIKVSEDSKQKEEFLDAIQGRLEQADAVIRDIITLRKGQKTGLQIEQVDVAEGLKKSYDSLVNPTEKHPRLSINVPGEVNINTDRARLQTVLSNVLSNAIKYHNYDQEDPYISVQINGMEEGLALEISDNGTGIDSKHLEKIFDMFYRASKNSNGTGLGLYLVRDTLSAMRSTISVSSQKGKGTTFHIYLSDHGPNHSGQ
ncbi:MAG: HAMP domain-containing histidine kinase [Ekhidna sp.]|nr:HAMP domain-containing histidine kinase [Ekhidna sp.]